jgi:hypothetical protein
LNDFIKNEAVTIALLFSGLFLYLAGTSPSVLHSTLVAFGLASVWVAILVTDVNRL